MTRRQMLARTTLGGVLLGLPAGGRADQPDAGEKYPQDKALQQAEKAGWVLEYRKSDLEREGTGLRGPSIVPAERFVLTPAILEAQFEGKGKCQLFMPSFAHVCNQTCLATKVEVEVGGKPLSRGRAYSVDPLVTRPLRNHFWKVTVPLKEKSRVSVRVTGIVSNAAEPADPKATRAKLVEVASQDNQFDQKYKVPPAPHWMKKRSKELEEALSEARGEGSAQRFTALEQVLRNTHKKAKLNKEYDKDLDKFVKEGWKGPCGANAEFVNLAAGTAGQPCLFYTEGYVLVRSLDYMGLHSWNTACSNGFFIADSLNPALFLPEYASYVATSVGRNDGHPNGPNGSTNGGWSVGKDTVRDYYIYFSMLGFGKQKELLAKVQIPEGVQLLGEFVARQRARVNQR
jgi:hypothetical protein